jgi:hypothetical protein
MKGYYIFELVSEHILNELVDVLDGKVTTTLNVDYCNERGELILEDCDSWENVTLSQLQGQCGVLVAYGLPHGSFADELVIAVLEAAKFLAYNTIILSDIQGSHHLLPWVEAGFKLIERNYNAHSGNIIEIYSYKLSNES